MRGWQVCYRHECHRQRQRLLLTVANVILESSSWRCTYATYRDLSPLRKCALKPEGKLCCQNSNDRIRHFVKALIAKDRISDGVQATGIGRADI